MVFRTTAVALSLITALGVVACGGDDDAASPGTDDRPTTDVVVTTEPEPSTEVVTTTTTTSTTTPTTTTTPERDEMLALELVDCERFGIGTLVDPTAARRFVPDNHELVSVQDRVPFTLQALSCDDLVTDGVSHGPGHFTTAWIAIVGSDQPPILPPESELDAVATDSYFPPLFHTDNAGFHAATAGFGIPMTLAESMTFDPSAAGLQTGAVIDREFVPALSYRWAVDNVNRTDTSVPIGRHTLLGLDRDGAELTYYGEFVHEPGWMGNVGTLDLEQGSAFEDLLGNSLTGPANGDDITITMTVFREIDGM